MWACPTESPISFLLFAYSFFCNSFSPVSAVQRGKNGSGTGQGVLTDCNGKHMTEIDVGKVINVHPGCNLFFSAPL